jgi:hypothetical protein
MKRYQRVQVLLEPWQVEYLKGLSKNVSLSEKIRLFIVAGIVAKSPIIRIIREVPKGKVVPGILDLCFEAAKIASARCKK